MKYTAKPKDEKHFCRIPILIKKDSKDSNSFHVAFFNLSPTHRHPVKQFHHQRSEKQALKTAEDWINANLFKIDNIQADNQSEAKA